MLSKSAFNALLKTLEEPPKHVVFIMATTDAHKVPITITSRAQTYNFKLADADTMKKFLKKVVENEKIDIDDDAVDIVVKRGGGSFRDSLSLLDQLATMSADKKLTKSQIIEAIGLPEDQIITELLNAYTTQNYIETSKIIKESIQKGIKPEILAEEIIKYIIEQPKPELLPLLEKLPSVTNPFPEAKLLLAFVKVAKAPEIHFAAAKTTVAKVSKDEIKTIEKEEVIVKETTDEDNTSFDFKSFIDKIKPKSNTLALTLSRDVNHEFIDDTLHLYPKNKFIYGRLDKTDNKQLLSQALGNFSLKIHDQNNVKKTPINEKISGIIGGEVEEIKYNGGEDIF